MFARILVPIDGGPIASRGLDEAIDLARDQKASVCVLHVVDERVVTSGLDGMNLAAPQAIDEFFAAMRAEGKQLLAQAATRVRRRGIAVETALVETRGSRVADLIIKQAKKWRADLIVLGTHGRRGLARVVLGSDAEAVVRQSPLPVLLVRAAPRRARRKA